jgi:integrase
MRQIYPHLYSRHGYFYYRQSITPSLRHLFGQNEIWASLRTDNLPESKLICAKLDLLYIQLSQCMKLNPTEGDQTAYKETQEKYFLSYKQALSPYLELSKEERSKSKLKKIYTTKKISDMWPKYLNIRRADGLKSLHSKKGTLIRFIDVMGDLTVTAIYKKHAQQFLEHLAAPTLALSPSTINGHISNMHGLFTWLYKTGEYQHTNPFSGLKLKESKEKRQKKDTYQKEDLKALFQCPIYTGSSGPDFAERLKEGPYIYQDSLYWAPLIAYYTGMRINEICQLHTKDVVQTHEYPYFDLNEQDGKRLKTASSHRRVPIHHTLIDLGFLDYVSKMTDKGEIQLFPEIRPGPYGNYGFRFSKKFARLLVKVGIKRPRLCFHSFRHTFIDNCKEAGIERSIAMAICGHDNGRSVHDMYGSGYSIRILSQEINRIPPMFSL